MAHFTITANDEFKGATVIFPDGTTQTIASDNPNYEKVVAALLANSLSDDDLLGLISPFELAYRSLTSLSERVSRKGMKIRFDGDVIDNGLTKHIIAIMDGGAAPEEWQAWVGFMEKLYQNPSKESQEHLLHFINANGLLLTPEGDIVAYKGTHPNGLSDRAGYAIVNGVEYDGVKIPNAVGDTVEIPRSRVDTNRGVACSVGLHVGAFSYASKFPLGGGANKLFTVIVNPRDVVSVPSDEQDRKIRVTRYRIVEENTAREDYKGTIKTFAAPAVKVAKVIPVTAPPAVAKVVPAGPAVAGSRVDEYVKVIRDLIALDPNTNLKRYRSKKITAGRRDEFTTAAGILGFKL